MPRAGWIAGLYEEAGTQFENHCSFYAEAGYRPLWAESCGFYAESLLERREAGDEAKAAKLIVDALRVAEELDMRPLAARLEYLSEQIDTTPPEYPDALSKREVEVLRLIAAGWSNQKIADELFISRWTVIRHVTHIFSKTGAHNRAEAAVYAERQGLSDRDTPGNGQ
jgi:DNA-binding CsgD family transcriptional regulator